MANDALFMALAQAKAQPDRWARAVGAAGQAGDDVLGGYMKGRQMVAAQNEAALKPYEIWSKISDSAGPDVANSIFKQRGIPVPDLGGSQDGGGQNYTPDQLTTMGSFGKKRLEAQSTAQGINEKGPRTAVSVKSNLIQAGLDPKAADAWLSANTDPTGMVQNKNYEDLIKGINAKNQGMRGNFMQGRVANMQLTQLPSQLGPNTAGGAAYQVKVAARQGKSLIAKATTPQNLALASVDLSRAIQRAAPTSETIGAGNYAQSLPTIFGQLQQKITSDPNSPDVPKLREQLYKTFDDLDKAATPWVQSHLQNMEDNGSNSTFGSNWQSVKNREMGMDVPDIPFDPGSGSAQNPNVSTGVPQGMVHIKDSQGGEHYLPQAAFGKAKQRDPGLQVLQ